MFDFVIEKIRELISKISKVLQSAVFKMQQKVRVKVHKEALEISKHVNEAKAGIDKAMTEAEIKRKHEKFKQSMKKVGTGAAVVTVAAAVAMGAIHINCKKELKELKVARDNMMEEVRKWEAEGRAIAPDIQAFRDNVTRRIMTVDTVYDSYVNNIRGKKNRRLAILAASTIASISGIAVTILSNEHKSILQQLKTAGKAVVKVGKTAANIGLTAYEIAHFDPPYLSGY